MEIAGEDATRVALQSRVDLTLWPELLEDSFGFVAACQMFVSGDLLKDWPERELHKSSMHTLDDAVRKISDDIPFLTKEL